MNEKNYKPIACGFYDELVLFASRKTPCLLTYLNADDQQQQITGLIKDIFSRESVEYLLLEDGLELRLDQIVSAVAPS